MKNAKPACTEYEKLEKNFLGIRASRSEFAFKNELTEKLAEELSQQERIAGGELLDHRIAHQCQAKNWLQRQ